MPARTLFAMRFCLRCDNTRFVCEAHPTLPWIDSPRGCRCGAAGDPCPFCNRIDQDAVPEMPDDFVTTAKREP